ncbi:hypothetical protein PGT21_021115 [Puccinia graminis f. sp. tritici]|uniref:Uncharacterized protein n=1 Tax=Puccinia graminis f. sp. tritici TaxID=56615 RepID=A0A5B0PUT3_PUCGR|nr:hypothetical protein PGTUg99_031359 [Puccinia graminis f. sp. tritici]KAA1104378.1 hypothetical protein PGT21_021115 [Puccinia graminis f. sp. tritici]
MSSAKPFKNKNGFLAIYELLAPHTKRIHTCTHLSGVCLKIWFLCTEAAQVTSRRHPTSPIAGENDETPKNASIGGAKLNAAGIEPTISRSQRKLLILCRRRAPYHWAMRPRWFLSGRTVLPRQQPGEPAGAGMGYGIKFLQVVPVVALKFNQIRLSRNASYLRQFSL